MDRHTQCSNCGLVAATNQFSGISQQCPGCGEWVIWEPLESADSPSEEHRPGRSSLDRVRDRIVSLRG